MKILYCIPMICLCAFASDSDKYSLEINQVLNYPSTIKKPADYTAKIEISSIVGALIKKELEENYMLVLTMSLEPIYLKILKNKEILTSGQSELHRLKELTKEVPEIVPCIAELQKRSDDFHTFLRNN